MPDFLPGETFLSYIARSAMENVVSTRAMASMYFDKGAMYYPWVLPRALRNFVNVTNGVHGDIDTLLSQHSIYWAIAPFLRETERETTYDAMLRSPPLIVPDWWTGPGRRSSMMWCPDCVDNDEREFGVSYWHREHQFPFVRRCLIHSTPLLTVCGNHCDLHRRPVRNFLPSLNCVCGAKPSVAKGTESVPSDGRLETRIHETADDLLYNPIPPTHYKYIGRTFQQAAIDAGFLDRDGLVRNRLFEFFDRVEAWAYLTSPSLPGGGRPHLALRRHLYDGTTPSQLEFSVVLISAMFDTAAEFREMLQRKHDNDEPSRPLSDESLHMWSTGSSLPTKKYKVPGPRWEKRRQTLDETFAAMIQSNHDEEIASSNKPVRMTYEFLTRDCPPYVRNASDWYQKTVQRLLALFEPLPQYQARAEAWERRSASADSGDAPPQA